MERLDFVPVGVLIELVGELFNFIRSADRGAASVSLCSAHRELDII